MSPLPRRAERQPDEGENHERPAWLWDKVSEEKEPKKKLPDNERKEDNKKRADKPDETNKEKKAAPKQEPAKENLEPDEEKQKRRSTLVEQSIALVARYEEAPIPPDASALARLMIAHQVVHLNYQLENSEGEQTPEEIEATLDYIAHLDAKFQDPSCEATPEIEQSYQEIIELARTTLEQEADPHTIIVDLQNQQENQDAADQTPPSGQHQDLPRSNDTNIRTQQEFKLRAKAAHDTLPAVATAVTLIHLIAHLGKKTKKEVVSAATSEGSSAYSPDASSFEPRTFTQPQQPSHEQPAVTRAETPPPTPEYTHSPNRGQIAIPSRRPPYLAVAAVATSFATPRTLGETQHSQQSAESSHLSVDTMEPTSHLPSAESAAVPQRKIEHLPLLQLLSMAENVSLGQGRYLRREFEAGHIDKEGLVKILKAHTKGRDYQFEFRQQADRLTKLKTTSPEFLHSAALSEPANTTNETPANAQPDIKHTPEQKSPTSSRPLSLAPPTTPELPSDLNDAARQPQQTAWRLAVITLAAIASLVLIGWLAVSIFNALN